MPELNGHPQGQSPALFQLSYIVVGGRRAEALPACAWLGGFVSEWPAERGPRSSVEKRGSEG
jgi:hypothetical protein